MPYLSLVKVPAASSASFPSILPMPPNRTASVLQNVLSSLTPPDVTHGGTYAANVLAHFRQLGQSYSRSQTQLPSHFLWDAFSHFPGLRGLTPRCASTLTWKCLH